MIKKEILIIIVVLVLVPLVISQEDNPVIQEPEEPLPDPMGEGFLHPHEVDAMQPHDSTGDPTQQTDTEIIEKTKKTGELQAKLRSFNIIFWFAGLLVLFIIVIVAVLFLLHKHHNKRHFQHYRSQNVGEPPEKYY